MRLLNLYVVYDERAKAIIGPVVHDFSPVPILRQITDAVKAEKGLIAQNPEDFVILHIGTINEDSGEITAIEPRILARAAELKNH